MGYAVVVWESAVSSKVFKREREDSMLISLSGAMVVVLGLYLLLRFADIIISGKAAMLMFNSGMLSIMFWIEIALFAVPMVMLMRAKDRANFATIFKASMLIMLAGGLYRFDTYMTAFNPGEGWSYFPTTLELLITLGVISFEIFLYIFIVKRYPILSGTRAGQARAIRREGLMARTITVDPITRIEGHLRIDVEVDRGKVQNSWSSGQMWRGIEKILEGRDPRDAWVFTQRICGVCTTVHAIASVRSVENALQINPPLNAQLIRNIC